MNLSPPGRTIPLYLWPVCALVLLLACWCAVLVASAAGLREGLTRRTGWLEELRAIRSEAQAMLLDGQSNEPAEAAPRWEDLRWPVKRIAERIVASNRAEPGLLPFSDDLLEDVGRVARVGETADSGDANLKPALRDFLASLDALAVEIRHRNDRASLRLGRMRSALIVLAAASLLLAAAAVLLLCADRRRRISEASRKSELAAAHEELRRARQIAEESNWEKTRFLAEMSLEIRSPLNGIIELTDRALDSDLNAEQRDYLEMTRLSADSLITLLDELLDLSRLERGRLELKPAPFLLRDTLGDVLKVMALHAHEKGIELAFWIEPRVPYALIGDAGRLRQVVAKLVGNAVRHTERGEVVVRVEPEAVEDDGTVLRFIVSDNGAGMALDRLQRMREALAGSDEAVGRKEGGVGLGLALSAIIVREMGGRLEVDSEPGKGSEFRFTARFGIQDPEASRPYPAPPPELEGIPLLVVDDNTVSREILCAMTGAWGMRPSAVADGPTALAALKHARESGEPFRLAVVDCRMPGMDGYTLAAKIQMDPEIGDTPMILLTTGERQANHRHHVRATCRMKPVTAPELLGAVQATIRKPSPWSDSEPEGEAEAAGPPLRILLAEDNAVNRMLTARTLRKCGHVVTAVESGRGAVAAIEQGRFDVVLMDLGMPVMDGLTATQRIRNLPEDQGGAVPIVGLTAQSLKGELERCLAAGMNACLTKPLNTPEIIRTIRRLTTK